MPRVGTYLAQTDRALVAAASWAQARFLEAVHDHEFEQTGIVQLVLPPLEHPIEFSAQLAQDGVGRQWAVHVSLLAVGDSGMNMVTTR